MVQAYNLNISIEYTTLINRLWFCLIGACVNHFLSVILLCDEFFMDRRLMQFLGRLRSKFGINNYYESDEMNSQFTSV